MVYLILIIPLFLIIITVSFILFAGYILYRVITDKSKPLPIIYVDTPPGYRKVSLEKMENVLVFKKPVKE